jgi:hypothetical protein
MGFPRRREPLLDTDVQLPAAQCEPDSATRAQRLGLLELFEAEQDAEEATRLRLAAPRSR